MQIEEVKNNIDSIIFDVLKEKIAFEDITPEKHLIEDLDAESSEVLEIFLTIMSDYDIEMERSEIAKLKNLGLIYQYVYDKIQAKNLSDNNN